MPMATTDLVGLKLVGQLHAKCRELRQGFFLLSQDMPDCHTSAASRRGYTPTPSGDEKGCQRTAGAHAQVIPGAVRWL